MDPSPEKSHYRAGRRSADLGGGGQRQNGRADRTGAFSHHRPGKPRGYRPAAHRHLFQCGGRGNAAENSPAAVRKDGAGAGKRRSAPAEPFAGKCRDLYHPCLLLPAHSGEFPGAGAARRYAAGQRGRERPFAGRRTGGTAGRGIRKGRAGIHAAHRAVFREQERPQGDEPFADIVSVFTQPPLLPGVGGGIYCRRHRNRAG